MKTSLLVGNWKMHGDLSSNAALLSALSTVSESSNAELAVCPPFVYLQQAKDQLEKSAVSVGAQDLSLFENKGAYTGEVSARMLRDIGCRYVIIGHSERRQLLNETDDVVAEKVLRALQAGLIPIVCVGETLDEREAGQALLRVSDQLDAVFSLVSHGLDSEIVIAYEPLWAIGTGKIATCEQICEMHNAIIRKIQGIVDYRVLYGGSVKAENAAEIFALDGVDGALVGGASLSADDFLSIFDSLNKSNKAI